MYLKYLNYLILMILSFPEAFILILTMHAVLKTSSLGILSYIIYNYIVIPLSLPELEDFRKHSGKNITYYQL